jgi:D-glycero-D-manno-heptose 1,7-bisphosphate phosphatase
MTSPEMRPAAFFDRDGILNVDDGYVHRVEDLKLMPGAAQAVKMCNDAGYWVFVITNQSGIGNGLYSEEAYRQFNALLFAQLAAAGARIDDVRFCPHHPEAKLAQYRQACDCRKPKPGMIRDLISAWPVDVSRSFLIGDRESDMEAGRAAGVRTYFYKEGSVADLVSQALAEAR